MRRAAELDAQSSLQAWAEYLYRQPGVVYLDGNSLGLLSKPAEAAVHQMLEAWKRYAIEGWIAGESPWFHLSRQIAGLLAPLLGTREQNLALGESVTVNLHQLVASFFQPSTTRCSILVDSLAFPTDIYVVQSQLRLRGLSPEVHLRFVPSRDGQTLHIEDLVESLRHPDVAFAVLPAVLYRSGQLLDMKRITEAGRQAGVTILWDCSHSVGVIPHQFDQDGIQLAVGCTYKYLNGGPGAVAFLHVSPELQSTLPGMTGWFGSDPACQFAMTREFQPAADAGRFLLGTPHILSLAPLLGTLPMFLQIGIEKIRKQSLELTCFLREMVEQELSVFGVQCVTPKADADRGGHITLQHPEAGRLSQALRERGIIPDFRSPDLLRLAPSPLYTTYRDIVHALTVLKELLVSGSYLESKHHSLVT